WKPSLSAIWSAFSSKIPSVPIPTLPSPMIPTFTSCIFRYYAGSAASPSEAVESECREHLRDGVPAIAPDRHADARVGEFPGQDVLAVAGALHPSADGRLHWISLAEFFENVLAAPPPGDPS